MILFANRDGGWVCKPNSVFNFMPMLNNTGKYLEQETKGNYKNCKTHYRSESSACSCKYCKNMSANILSILSNYF